MQFFSYNQRLQMLYFTRKLYNPNFYHLQQLKLRNLSNEKKKKLYVTAVILYLIFLFKAIEMVDGMLRVNLLLR